MLRLVTGFSGRNVNYIGVGLVTEKWRQFGTMVAPPGLDNETTYSYDGFGRLIKTTSPDASTTIYVYNPDGSLAQKKEGCPSSGTCMVITNYDYDEIGRLTEVGYGHTVSGNFTPLGYNEYYFYDGDEGFTIDGAYGALYGGTYAMGRMSATMIKQYDDGEGSIYLLATVYSYWPDGRVRGKHYQVLAKGSEDYEFATVSWNPVSYSYDQNGTLQQITAKNGRRVYYCLDDDDPTHPSAIKTATSDITSCAQGGLTTIASAITWYPFGDIKRIVLGNGQIQNFARDKRYALTGLTDGYTGALTAYHDIEYGYTLSDIKTIDENVSGTGQYPDHALSYDNLHQLAGATIVIGNSVWREAFEYNKAGNRTSRTLGQTEDEYTYTTGSNRLASISGGKAVSFTYDDMGRMTLYTEVSGGVTVKAQSSFMPQGLMFTKEDWIEDQGEVTVGDTVAQLFTPSAERMLKVNFSTGDNRVFAYDLSGNLLAEGSFHEVGGDNSDEPLIQHVWLGNHLIASITGSGEACFIVTAAYRSPLAGDLQVFRALRDRWLERFEAGKGFINWYYKGGGPEAAKWLQSHDTARLGTRIILSIMAVPLKVFLFGKITLLLLIFLLSLGVLVVSKKLGWTWPRSSLAGLALAIGLVIGYSYLMDVPEASASYTEGDIYYYTSDHIGRPFNLRDADKTLTWHEHHLAFGEPIHDVVEQTMSAGSGDYVISWKPNFRFPGQYQDDDMGLSYTSSPLFVQNHYREYMPGLGRYNRVDLIQTRSCFDSDFSDRGHPFLYANNNPIIFMDQSGLLCCSLDEIERRITQVQSMLPGGASGITCASTICLGTWPRTEDNTERCTKDPCVRDCIMHHESIHRKQCIEGRYHYAFKTENEKEAYQAELNCLLMIAE